MEPVFVKTATASQDDGGLCHDQDRQQYPGAAKTNTACDFSTREPH